MHPTIALGGASFPTAVLVLVAAVACGVLTAKAVGRRPDAPGVSGLAWRIAAVGIVMSRLAFVYQFRVGYVAAPWQVLDIRDGGWDPDTGLVCAWLFAVLQMRGRPFLRKPLVAGLTVASLLWAGGAMAIAMGSAADRRLSGTGIATLQGGVGALAGFRGKPSVVNLWATWCPPCQRELPLLRRAQVDHPEIHFVFLNQGESAGTVEGYLAARGLRLDQVLLDAKGQVGAEYGSGALPTTLLFDDQGRLVGTHLGEVSEATLASLLSRLAASK